MTLRTFALGLLGAAALGAGTWPALSAEALKIGMLTSLSGYVANMGLGGRDGLMLAIDEVNAAGGVNGRKIEVVQLNDESDATKGVPLATRLLQGDKVLAVVGPVRSDIVEAVAPMMIKSQVVDMVGSTILPTKSDYAFATAPTPGEEAPVAVAFLKQRGAKSVAILSAIDVWARTLSKTWAEEAEKQGLKVVSSESYNSATDKNFIPQLSKFKAAGADWILVTGAGPAAGLILKQKAEIGYDAQVFGSTTFPVAGISALVEIGGPQVVEGVHFAATPFSVWDSLPADDPRSKRIGAFRDAFKAKYGREPDSSQWWVGQNYDIGMLLAGAMKKAGPDVTGEKIRAALESVRDHQGVLGVTYNYGSGQHAGVSGVVVAQIKSGKVVLVSP